MVIIKPSHSVSAVIFINDMSGSLRSNIFFRHRCVTCALMNAIVCGMGSVTWTMREWRHSITITSMDTFREHLCCKQNSSQAIMFRDWMWVAGMMLVILICAL